MGANWVQTTCNHVPWNKKFVEVRTFLESVQINERWLFKRKNEEQPDSEEEVRYSKENAPVPYAEFTTKNNSKYKPQESFYSESNSRCFWNQNIGEIREKLSGFT